MGLKPGPRREQDDDLLVATVECPSCHESVLIELDPDDVVCWEEEGNVVNEIGPPSEMCCGRIFIVQPDGRIEAFALRGADDREEGD